jgi:hypothetical protein
MARLTEFHHQQWSKGFEKKSKCMSCHPPPRSIYLRSSGGGKWPCYLYSLNRRYTLIRGTTVKKWYSHRGDMHPPQFSFHLLQAPWSLCVSPPPPRSSQHARTPSLPAEPSVLTLWLKQGTRRFCGEISQTPQTWCSLDAKLALTWPPRSSRLGVGFVE